MREWMESIVLDDPPPRSPVKTQYDDTRVSRRFVIAWFECLDLRLQENLDAAGGPNGNAGAEEVGVLGPNRTAQD
jgi:hypothetical protein